MRVSEELGFQRGTNDDRGVTNCDFEIGEDILNFIKSAAMILIFTISISILSWAEDFDVNFGG